MKIKQTIREFCLWPQDAAGMRLGKTISNKFACFALDFHYICPVKIVA